MDARPMLFVISGPSGAGKGTALDWMERSGLFKRVATYTTRPPRPQEYNGVDYNFIDEDTFFSLYKNGEIFEYTRTYSDSYYGSPRILLEADDPAALAVELDPVGFTRVRATSKRRVVGIFITTENEDQLRSRLAARGHVTDTSQRLRIRTSQQNWAWVYDYVLVNNERTEFLTDLATVAKSEIIRFRGAQYLTATQHEHDPTLHPEG